VTNLDAINKPTSRQDSRRSTNPHTTTPQNNQPTTAQNTASSIPAKSMEQIPSAVFPTPTSPPHQQSHVNKIPSSSPTAEVSHQQQMGSHVNVSMTPSPPSNASAVSTATAPSVDFSLAATESTPRGAITEQSAYSLPGAPALQKARAASLAGQHTTFESLSCSDGDGAVNSNAESISVQLEMSSMQQIDESEVASPALVISFSDSTAAEENATAIQQPTSKEEEEIKEEFIEEESFSKNNIVLCVRVESIRRLVKFFNGRECRSDLAPLSQPSDEGRMHIFVSCVRYVILSFFATLLFLVQGLPFGFVREGIGTCMPGKHTELYGYF
jgi:hypothetical protein